MERNYRFHNYRQNSLILAIHNHQLFNAIRNDFRMPRSRSFQMRINHPITLYDINSNFIISKSKALLLIFTACTISKYAGKASQRLRSSLALYRIRKSVTHSLCNLWIRRKMCFFHSNPTVWVLCFSTT